MTLTIKLCRLPIALLLLLLEQLETGTGAGQEQPEALPQRGAKGPKRGSVRRQRPSRTEFRSQVCTGLLSPPPWPPHPPPKWVPTADPFPTCLPTCTLCPTRGLDSCLPHNPGVSCCSCPLPPSGPSPRWARTSGHWEVPPPDGFLPEAEGHFLPGPLHKIVGLGGPHPD